MLTPTKTFTRELEIKLIFLFSTFMVQFFHGELAVERNVHGPVVLESLNAEIETVRNMHFL
jgi:hypothetical protein